MWPGVAGGGLLGKPTLPQTFKEGHGVDPDRPRPIAALLYDEGWALRHPDSLAHFLEIFALQTP
jgi:hypothetical protein